MKRRAHKLAALPEDDGLIPVLMKGLGGPYWGKVTPEAMHEHCARVMAIHDARDDELRWGGNQWGEEWVVRPETRLPYAKRMPLLPSDLSLKAWRRLLAELLGKSTSPTPSKPSTTWKDEAIQSLNRITGSRPRTSTSRAS